LVVDLSVAESVNQRKKKTCDVLQARPTRGLLKQVYNYCHTLLVGDDHIGLRKKQAKADENERQTKAEAERQTKAENERQTERESERSTSQ
jgi:16S rRNA G527 N7-methylase RsmG